MSRICQRDECSCSDGGIHNACSCIAEKHPRDSSVMRCRECYAAMVPCCDECGCTDDNACAGGCFWVNEEKNLCSACGEA